ncbi:amidohydrolase [Pseudochryseolinea flava]|uniref:Amidohydrolase n=1 Tax=Pseudochryseolinea flava TaxID=2059302 RepID=A0A364Y533_9BACT|nr:amidohydrolase [Pseudochryseolinea flava]RAW01434.1 amidohydrolase [Pseudochryseolinea flava]
MRLKLLCFIVGILFFQCTKQASADLIIRNGNIYTMDEQSPIVSVVAVRDGVIVYAGDESGVPEMTGEDTNVIDLDGATMTPGLIEGHGHIMGIGYNEMNLDLMNAASFDEIVSMVKNASEKAQPGEWIVGRGWHQDKWTTKPTDLVKGFPVHKLLSEASPNNPVLLHHASGHAAMANAKAMEIAGVVALPKEGLQSSPIEGGEIIRDDRNNPTGIFVERSMSLITKHVPAANQASDRKALMLAIDACHRNGITSFHDAGASRTALDLFHKLKAEKKLSLRLYAMVSGEDPALMKEWFQRGPEIDADHWLTIRSIKLHCDGALGSRGAWLLEPYADRHETSGMPTYPMDSVLAVARLGLKHGFQICAHAIGDRANKEILDRYEIAFKENAAGAKDHRFRIEHAQHLHPNDIARFGQLKVIPAMQAIHMSSDRPWAIDRLGKARIKSGAYMWQALLKSGARIVNGTDAPVEPINPIASFYASVARKTLKGTPPEGYESDQRMTREQALRSYTLDAAYGAFEENIKGSITVGKLADFTVLSQDIMKIEEGKILKTDIVMTIVGGKVVYKRKV